MNNVVRYILFVKILFIQKNYKNIPKNAITYNTNIIIYSYNFIKNLQYSATILKW